MRPESKVDRREAVLEDLPPALAAAPREVSKPFTLGVLIAILIKILEFAHGKVDPVEAGKKGGNS